MAMTVNGPRQDDLVQASQRQQEVVAPFSPLDVEMLFTFLMRFPAFFKEARDLIQPHYFDATSEPHYRCLWRSMCRVWDQNGGFTALLLSYAVLSEMRSTETLITEDNADMLISPGDGIIYSAMRTPDNQLLLPTGRDLLKRFLHERTVTLPLRRLMTQGVGGHYLSRVPELLVRVREQQQRIDGLGEVPCGDVAPPIGTAIAPPAIFHSTGVRFIDDRLGGQREGDANGLLGVTGGGKSTLGAYMLVESARISNAAAGLHGLPPLSALFSYEEPAERINPRVQSAAFHIRRTKLEQLADWGQLTTPQNMEDYEIRMQMNSVERLSESQRWSANYTWLNKCTRVFDMSGSGRWPNAGRGYISEIVACLERTLSQSGQVLRTVVLDYAGLICKRYMQANNIPEERLRYFLAAFGDLVRREIAERFGCTVWALHQIAAASCNASPTKLLHHNDSAECKAFADNLAVCGCMGVVDPVTGCRRLNFSKVRYKAVETITPVTLRINENFAWLEDVGNQFVAAESGRGFVDRETANRVEGSFHADRGISSGPIGLRSRSEGAISLDDAR